MPKVAQLKQNNNNNSSSSGDIQINYFQDDQIAKT